MKKFSVTAVILSLFIFAAGCSSSRPASDSASSAAQAETESVSFADPAKTESPSSEDQARAESASSESGATDTAVSVPVRVGSLKGPTSMGLVYLMDKTKHGESALSCEFTMTAAADELVGKMVKGDLDIALLPANVASVIYNKTKNVSVIDINTLGVLYMVSSDDSIASVADLKGKRVYLTGMGTTPDYVLRYLIKGNGLTEEDVTLEYKSEPTEVAAILKENPSAIGLLPQPFVTAACAQNEALKIVLDLTEEWDKLQDSSGQGAFVTGVTIVNNDFLKEHPDAVTQFLAEHKESALYTSDHPDEAAGLIAAAGIVEKAPIAKKALPYCNITCITGEMMHADLNGYLKVLFEADPSSIGGALPEEDFYYIP